MITPKDRTGRVLLNQFVSRCGLAANDDQRGTSKKLPACVISSATLLLMNKIPRGDFAEVSYRANDDGCSSTSARRADTANEDLSVFHCQLRRAVLACYFAVKRCDKTLLLWPVKLDEPDIYFKTCVSGSAAAGDGTGLNA